MKKVDNNKVKGNSETESIAEIKKNQIDSYDEVEHYKKILKKRRKKLIARFFIFLFLLIITPIMIFVASVTFDKNAKHDFFGLCFCVVISNSMEPEININDCVVIKKLDKSSQINIGDDIGYVNSSGDVVIHRVIGIETTESGETRYITKGIHNTMADDYPVSKDSVVGIKVGTSKVFGRTVVFFRSTAGIIVMILIFVVIAGVFIVAFRVSEDIRYVEKQDNL